MNKTLKTAVSIILVSLTVSSVAFAAINSNLFKKEIKETPAQPKKIKHFLEDFDVHEWGVFYQKYNGNCSYLLNPDDSAYFDPDPPRSYPLKPVIYFHHKDNLSSVTVEVNISEDLITIPDAKIVGDKIQWTFSLENNKVVLENGSIFDYLFYEGKIPSSQPVKAFVLNSGTSTSFYIKNTADYPLSNIFFNYCHPTYQDIVFSSESSDDNQYDTNNINVDTSEPPKTKLPVEPPNYPPISITFSPTIIRNHVFIERLDPGDSLLITKPMEYNTDCFNYSLIEDVLNETALTDREIADLMNYWDDIWFEPQIVFDEKNKKWKQNSYGLADSAQILYMIPEEKYDTLLPIDISPKPEFLKRVGLFYITDIPVKNSLTQNDALNLVLSEVLENSLDGEKIYYSPNITKPNTDLGIEPYEGQYVSPDGYSWFFFIDDHPKTNWSHPCRYVFVELDGDIKVIDGGWWPKNSLELIEIKDFELKEFKIFQPVYNLDQIPVVSGGLTLEINERSITLTTGMLPCCNYGLEADTKIKQNTIEIDVKKLVEPEICLTACGKASYTSNLGKLKGEYKLIITHKGKIYGSYLLDL